MILYKKYPIPDPSVLYYQRETTNGYHQVATIHTIDSHERNGTWRALFRVPGMADFQMDQHNSELDQWEAVYAVTQNDVASLMERAAQRAVEIMQSQGASHSDSVIAAMELVTKDAFTCKCGKDYKLKKNFAKHRKSCAE